MYLVFDIGGTKMRLAISRDGRRLSSPLIFQTPQRFDVGLKLFNQACRDLCRGKKIKAAVGGVAGVLNRQKNKLLHSPNLTGWVSKPLQQSLRSIIKAPVYLENDADLAGLGEATKGAGRGYQIVAYLTISTGVGGTRIVGGRIDHSAWGFEPGHQTLLLGNHPQTLGRFVGGNQLARRFGRPAQKLNDRRVWQQINRFLGYALNNVVVFWSPNVIVLGGGLTNNKNFNLNDIARYLRQTNTIFPQLPPLKRAKLKDSGGLEGALQLINQGLGR